MEVLPKKEGLLHVSKLGLGKVKNVSDVLKVGQHIKVEVIDVDRFGRFKLAANDLKKDE